MLLLVRAIFGVDESLHRYPGLILLCIAGELSFLVPDKKNVDCLHCWSHLDPDALRAFGRDKATQKQRIRKT